MLIISKVKRKSLAKELGLEVGDGITAFDGLPCEDELDLLYFNEQESFTMTVKDHRTGCETADVQGVMDGNVEPFIVDYLKKS